MFKMRVLCCACFLIVAAVPVSAQTINATSGWVWQNPWPQGNNLNGVFLLDSRNIFAVGDNGRFMKSSDGGATWTVDNLESPILKSIFCTNTNTCIALGFDHTRAGVYQTKDGGNTWAVQVIVNRNQIFSDADSGNMSCTDANTCTVTIDSAVLRTTDGWATWTSQTPAPSGVTLLGISCTDLNTCTIAAGGGYSDGYILRTTDGGNTWNEVYTSPGNALVTAISCADDNNCMALQGYGILQTTDGGTTWAFSTWTSQLLTAIFCSGVNTCTAVGNGQIVQTFDGGSTWSQQPSGLTPDVDSTAVACAGPNNCLAAGKLGSLLQTTDGTDWARLDRVATRDEIDVVSCTDSNTCTAGGPHSPIMRTNNAGVTWSPQTIPATFFVTAISCTDDNTCTAVGEDNTAGTYIAGILHTTDGGNTWTQQQQSNGTPRPLEAVSCTDNNTCTALGAGCTSTCSSIILRTTDGGTTWTQSFEYVSSSTINQSYLRDLSCPDSNTCTAVGQQLAGTVFTILILRTTDGGTTWIQQSARAPIPSGIACPDVNTCIAVGGGGSVRTTDGGATWTVANSGIFPSHVSCLNGNTCIEVGGPSSSIARTTDGGSTWTLQTANGANLLYGVSCTGANTCTAVGPNGTILRTISSPQSAGAAFDNAVSSGFQWSVNTASTPAFAVGNAANRAAMIMVAMSANNATGITASFGGVSGTLVPGTDSGTTASIRTLIYCVVNPPSGSQTATVSWTGTMDADVGVITASGADQTTPCTSGTFAATDSAPSPTTSVTVTSNPGDLTASFGYTSDTSWASPPTSQTLKWGVDSGAVGGDIGPGTGTATHSWTDQYFYQTHSVSGANFKAASQ